MIGKMTDDNTKDQTTDEKLGLVLSELRKVKAKLSMLEASAKERTKETRLKLDKIIQEIFNDERLKGLKLEEEADQRLSALINTQVRYEVRQELLEEAFRQVAESHQVLVQLASSHGERLDGHGKANVQTDSRLDALIDAQIQLLSRVETLTSGIAALNGSIDRIGAHLDQAVGQIKALADAQTLTDEQIKILLARGGSTKTARASTKAAKKGAAQ